MKNPFEYGRLVTTEAFCNRTKEIAELTRLMENEQSVFLYSERRVGKTSLIKKALAQLSKDRYITVYVDLWPTRGEVSFIGTYAKALAEACNPTADKMLEAAQKLFSSLQPSVTIDESGKPEVNFGLSRGQLPSRTLLQVLDAPVAIAARQKKQVVVVFDEFQEILNYENDQVEKQLRSSIQNRWNGSYAFVGSRKHLMRDLFLDPSRPLYRSATHFPLGSISEEDWTPFIINKFANAKKTISKDLCKRLSEETEGHPFYTQQLCHVLWDLTEEGDKVTDDLITQALDTVLERESNLFSVTWESLPSNQRKVLVALATLSPDVKLFSNYFIDEFGFGKPSSVKRAVEALLKKSLVDEDAKGHFIPDRFFRLWIRQLAGRVPFHWSI